MQLDPLESLPFVQGGLEEVAFLDESEGVYVVEEPLEQSVQVTLALRLESFVED